MCSKVVVILLALVARTAIAQPEDSPDFQSNLPPPELVWAAQGQDAELPCDVTPPVIGDRVNMVLWFKDNAGIPLYSLDARGGALEHGAHWAMGSPLGARTFFLVGSGGTAGRLRVNNVEASDQGVYRCRVDFLNSRTRNFRVNLTIVVPPDLPMIYDAQGDEVSGEAGPFLEGYDLFLSCHVSGGRPQAAVSWWMGAQLLDAIHDGSSGNVSVNQLFISSVGRALWGQRLACHGRNSNLTAPVVREVALLIYLKPRKVHIGVGRGETLSAGRIQTLRCEAWGSVPAPRITWLLDGEPLRLADTVVTHGSNSSWSALTMQPTPHDHGRELTCRAENPRFPGGFVEDRLRLNIAYAPVATVKLGVNIDPATIKEGDNVYLSCEVTANPMPAYVSWMHNEKPLEQDPEAGVLTGERRLLLKAVTRLAAGTYQCVASNSEGESRSEPLLLRVQFAPRCRGDEGSRQVGALRHETLAVRCEVEADPPSVRFSWTYNRSRDVLHVPGSRVHSAGLTSTLDYTPVSDVDFGTLACWASNAVGRQKQPCLFHVVPARAPRPPEQCAVSNSTGGAGLEVTCVAGDDGGLPQYFVLEVTETRPEHALGGRRRNRGEDDDSGEEQEVAVGAAVQADGPIGESPPLLRVLSAEPRFALDSLDPTRRYDLTVHAANARGRSDPVLLARVRVLASEEHRLASTGNTSTSNEVAQPAALVLGALVAVASLALCCLFAAVAAVLCRHRRAAPRSRPQPPADKPLELSVIAPPPPAPAPATVRPHRHLGPHRRSAGQQDNDPSSQTALLTEQVNDPSWRRSSGDPQQQQQQRSVEPDLIVSKAEVVLHLQSAAMAAKAPRSAVLTSPSGQEVALGSRA